MLGTAARRTRTRIMLFAAVAVVAIGIGVAALAAHALRSVELNTVDTRFSIRGRLGDTRRVVVVAIDSRTFSGFGNRVAWPFPRRYEAKVIDRIAAGKPAAVAVDIQFTEPTDPKDDNALIESVAKAGRVVLAATEVDAHGNTNVFGGSSVVKEIGAHVGSALLAPDADGVIRHVPNAVQGLTTFGIAAAAVARDAAVPAAQTGSHWIDFAGPPGTIKTYSFSDVYSGKVPARAFRGKVVVVGPTAPSLQDVHATSYGSGSPMSGAEIQANVVESALRDFPLSGTPTWLEVVLIAFLGIVPASTYRFRALATAVAAVVVGGAYTVSTQLAFDHGTVLPFTYPMLALALSTVGSVGVWYVLEVFERARTRDVFARFVPEAVVDQVLQRTGGELRLGGETVFGTVMFTDLRGFTSFSEGRSAEQVIGLLNRYLASMSDAVLAHGGTLVTYTGDGMMAVFGAPLPQDDHADRALGAAREMLEVRLPEFNDWLATQGEQKRLKMGVGLNSGEFMSGNVGSERRLEYTAIGDTINTASRIEGMTKGTPYALFMASSTRETLREPPDDLVYVDEMAVRGRSGTIQIWSVSSELAQKADWRSETSNPDPSPA